MEMVEWRCEDGCQDAAAVLRPVLLLPVEGVLLALSGCGKPRPSGLTAKNLLLALRGFLWRLLVHSEKICWYTWALFALCG